jgi:tRNA1Val (adenine37-N6)-methyltransferase
VKPGGRICFIYHVSRLPEIFMEALSRKLAPARLRLVHGSPTTGAQMALIELSKGKRKEMAVLPPFIVYGNDGAYSGEMTLILGEDDAQRQKDRSGPSRL